MGIINKNKMCSNNDKGCCFCLPSYISLVLLAIFDIFVFGASIHNVNIDIDFGEFYDVAIYVNILLAVWQILPFGLFLVWRDAAWPRFLIFLSHFVTLVWMSVFYIIVILVFQFIYLSLSLFGSFKFAQAATKDSNNQS